VRLLFGPLGVGTHAALGGYGAHTAYLGPLRELDGRTFGGAGTDIPYRPAVEPLDALFARLPDGWRPDALTWWAPEYTPLPQGIEACPIPSVALLGDWQMNFWGTLGVLEAFDLVVADVPGVELLAARGIPAEVVRLWSFDPALHRPVPGVPRDIDVLFVGALNADLWWERAAWVRRVLAQADRHRILVTTGVYGEEYARLLSRARIVFNRSYRGEMNMRAYEAAAAGALLFIERGNRDAAAVFTDRVHCVYYGEDLEALLDHYLAHEDERAAIARAGRERVLRETARHHLEDLLEHLRRLSARGRRPRRLGALPPPERAWRLGLKAFLNSDPSSWRLALRYLAGAEGAGPASRLLGTVASVLAAADAIGDEPSGTARVRALDYAARALGADPADPIHHLRAGELALSAGDRDGARRHLEAAAGLAGARGRVTSPSLPFPFAVDRFRLAWDRAAAAGDEALAEAAARLVEARARVRLAQLANEEGDASAVLRHLSRSSEAWPNVDGNTLSLGDVYMASGAHDDAVEAFRRVIEAYPLNFDVILRLGQALRAAGRHDEVEALVRDTLRMLSAFPSQAGWIPAFRNLPGGERT
jgi:tetratricopeptide (TPR) repeat protein